MAHVASNRQQAAIFSPSVARAAASTAKDWTYVNNWLVSKYYSIGGNDNTESEGDKDGSDPSSLPSSSAPANFSSARTGRKLPPFERNPDTLKVLLALAAVNEAADEDCDRLAHLEEAALDAIRRRQSTQPPLQSEVEVAKGAVTQPDGAAFAEDLLAAIQENLSREGCAALDAMAGVAVELDVAYPESTTLGVALASLRGRALELEDATARLDLLLRPHLDRETAATVAFLADLERGDTYQPAPDLAKQNLELQRRVRAGTGDLSELQKRVLTLERTVGIPPVTVGDVRADEDAYLALLARKKDLDAQVKAFAGLPPDIETARAELEALRAELRNATKQRDADFEKLVERESPVKIRRRP
ncbi:hypothetical protein GGS23DRAFT_608328 [Durotheca rogersii]|uniref:uncharacterized protein n=1 Tax=Durotheca rogersii TaxID=419775 RepID=UPI002220FE4E|nr:uncharacterized protein GGS23DRAFT_608328 [Durotheca rogersii]KAI5854096.1 hypothetical protein GGS23DRAFT_608328 [Durotheca rogersii]